ncbi:5-oxoprolinase subunit C family protein [Paenibacillus aestuarii]|uniref:Biotin-dependent carboxyltransferase family protein n=1 Tax=Paenibacillus aestuarii TaxID=516965 RepID=A0ABW0K9W2_9BACL|nr:biotin-dependent carboxyltransferase family protein [Paenibacillus aestuarii]
MSLLVRRSGRLSTLQREDCSGLHGGGALGPWDRFAHRSANLLVGNDARAAVLEMTLQGGVLQAQQELLAAICGADMGAELDGERVPLWRPFRLPAGSLLSLGYAVQGCRSYLAVAGGLDGARGEAALQAGDVLDAGTPTLPSRRLLQAWGRRDGRHAAPGYVSTYIRPVYAALPTLRFIRGREAEGLTDESMRSFCTGSFKVAMESGRIGCLLEGAKLTLQAGASDAPSAPVAGSLAGSTVATGGELIGSPGSGGEATSSATLGGDAGDPGTLLLPASGQPCLLMTSGPVAEGYARIGRVISADLPLAAQVKPGSYMRFEEVSPAEAQMLQLLQQLDLRFLQAGLKMWVQDYAK